MTFISVIIVVVVKETKSLGLQFIRVTSVTNQKLITVSICKLGWLGGKGKSHNEGENVHCLESVLTLDLPKFVTPLVYKFFFLVSSCLMDDVVLHN